MSGTEPRLGGISVKSHIPGRLRLRLPQQGYAEALRRLESCREFGLATSLSLNPHARSALVHYDARAFTPDDFLACLSNVCETGNLASATTLRERTALPPEEAIWSGFSVRCDLPGHLRVRHPLLGQSPTVQRTIRAGLMKLNGVRRYRLTPETSSLLVSYRPENLSRRELVDALVQLTAKGLTALRDAGPEPEPAPLTLHRLSLQLSFSTTTLGLAVAAVAWPALGPIALAGTVAASLHTLANGVKGLIHRRRPTVDTLDATTIVIGLLKQYTLPVAAMVWLLNFSERLLDSTYRDSRELVTEFFGDRDQVARCLIDGQFQERNIAALRVGDIVIVFSGEQIPVDGTIVEGRGMVDQSVLTGEYSPVDRLEGEEVFARTTILAGQLQIRVVRSGKDTYAASLMRILEQSLQHRVHLQTMCEQFAERMVIPTYLLGGIAQLARGPDAMLAVLNADFGTGIRIAGPSAMLSSISVAIENDILVKDGSVLERLHQMNAIIFDKTGTLTDAVPAVRQVVSFGRGWDERMLLSRVASAEQRFHHPIAKAILREALAWEVPLSPLIRSEYQAGLGIEVSTSDGLLRVGSRRYIERVVLKLDERELAMVDEASARGSSCIFASLDDRIMGMVELEAVARPEASAIIQHLRAHRGIQEIYLISGDHEAATAQLAEQLGIDKYFSNVLPKDKVQYVQKLQSQGLRVAMIGDGVNDSAALSQADCGISLRGGADAAIDAADIIFMDGRLRNLDLLIEISENLRNNVRMSFRLLVFCNSFLILGALLGGFGLGTSVVMNNVLNLMATVNGLRVQDRLQAGKKKPRTVTEELPA